MERRLRQPDPYRLQPADDHADQMVQHTGSTGDVGRDVLGEERTAGQKPYRAALEDIPQMVWSMGTDGGDVHYNAAWVDFTGVIPGSAGAPTAMELLHPEDRERTQTVWRTNFSAQTAYEHEHRLWHVSGQYRWVLDRCFPQRSDTGAVAGWCGICTDIHERVLAFQALAAGDKFHRAIIDNTPDCVVVLDNAGHVAFANRAFMDAVQAEDAEALIGHSWLDYVPPEERKSALTAFAAAQDGECGRFTLERPTAWWDVVITRIRADTASREQMLIIARDLTLQKLAEDRVRWTANHDALTDLPNRTLLYQRLDQMLDPQVENMSFALVLLDVDHLKRTNDALGHDAGDTLLRCFAERLKAVAGPDDIVARFGGDEFALLLAGVTDATALQRVVEDIGRHLEGPCTYGTAMLDCRASMGASLYPSQACDRISLLKQADIALYAAKASGRRTFRLFKPSMQVGIQNRNLMLDRAKAALANNQIVPFYQPKIDLRTGQIVGFEALLRTRNPAGEIDGPDSIAAAFDDSFLAAALSECMIDQVIDDMQAWQRDSVEFKHVAINAAAAEFRRGDFAEQLLQRMSTAGLPATCLQIEVTETVFLGRGADYVEHALKTLSDAGIRIALDDFGTGFASLAHLKQFPVDILKIDRSFIQNLQLDEDDGAIVDAVIGLGKSLKIEIVAEGIETPAQHDVLVALGCEYGQGFLYGKAVEAQRVPAISKRRRHLRTFADPSKRRIARLPLADSSPHT